MGENSKDRDSEAVPGTGVNDHVWEREHRHPTAAQARAIGYRPRDAEINLEQHQQLAREKTDEYHQQHQ